MGAIPEPTLERNLSLVAIHKAMTSFYVVAPISILFLERRVGLDGALVLNSIYYLFMVLLEVPSGWASDRFGRVITLRVGAVGFAAAHLLYLVGNNFAMFAVAEAMMAVGYACLSGTDVSFHYDSLESLERADEFPSRQAKVVSLGFWSAAIAALVGGASGLIDLRWAYAVGAIVAVAEFGVTMAMKEPPTHSTTDPAHDIITQIGACIRRLANPILGWVFFYGVALVVLEHVVSVGLQPWLTIATGNTTTSLGSTPLWSGVITAAVAIVGSQAARLSVPLARRWGSPVVLVGLGVLTAVIISAMTVSFSLWVLVLVLFRSSQHAVADVLMSAMAAPRLPARMRATFLSLNSLAGRLFWSGVLFVVSRVAGDDVTRSLAGLSITSWALVGILIMSLIVAARRGSSLRHVR